MGGLGSLSRARWAEHDDFHRRDTSSCFAWLAAFPYRLQQPVDPVAAVTVRRWLATRHRMRALYPRFHSLRNAQRRRPPFSVSSVKRNEGIGGRPDRVIRLDREPEQARLGSAVLLVGQLAILPGL